MKPENLIILTCPDWESVPISLLLLADPDEKRLEAYIKTGSCYIAKIEDTIIGVLVLKEINPTTLEIKNIAIDEPFQGYGFGSHLLNFASEVARDQGYKSLIIATGNSSIGQLKLYQRIGFEIFDIEMNYFTLEYQAPIYENGIQCKHKIFLRKDLNNN
ncbi:GNAT family N-acetyltransferase [Poritiphilus flavus]|uniref:GNAT family N-acetyltransferase n=1 Tax=Poritiphilus flavus TaxID=2697053 RepID=A0A6L9E8S8_9FLAO|nr:GNAT family N-acetyltransferase [Poritiphilus flavus]NAS11150.1 GNAT family N-acetyltransferase [Poritiphilus flavus]